MGIKITEVGIVVPGQITRKYDKDADETTLVFNAEQAHEAQGALDTVLEFFEEHSPKNGATEVAS